MQRRLRYLALAALVLAGISGCVREETDGATRVFSYELWVPVTVFLGGLVAAPAGWFLRETSFRFGWGLLILGPVAAIGFAPSLYRDRATLDETGFSLRTGIWGMTAVHDVKFNDLKQVRIVAEEERGRRGAKRTNYYVLCERKDGTSAKVPVGNKVAEAALPQFIKEVSNRGVPVVDQT